MNAIDHERWSTLLANYVDDNGSVDYARWKRTDSDLQALDAYLAELSRAEPRSGSARAAQIAFWINAYNSVTIKGILREYPTTSIRNHTARLLGYNIWHDLLLTVGDEQFSLDTMEHKILRKLGEPRIHFAIVCASRSCPRLLNQAYTASSLEQQLANNTRAFFAHRRNFQHDTRGQKLYLSSIINWFAEDFGGDQASRLRTIAPYLPSPAARAAARSNSVSVSYLDYDWSLNDQRSVRSGS